MKINVQTLAVLELMFFIASCSGRKLPTISENMPNQMVPIATMVEEPASSDEPVPPAKPETPKSETDAPEAEPDLQRKTQFTLAEKATFLGRLDQGLYIDYQKKWVGSAYPACNFFLITALCEADYCKTAKPFYKAGDFDLYFIKEGWKTVKLADLKEMFMAQAASGQRTSFDAVFQKSGVNGGPGHVMVAIGYDSESDQMIIAQGNLGEATNEIKEAGDYYLENWRGGFNIFVKQ